MQEFGSRYDRAQEQLFISLRKASLPRYVSFAAEPLSKDILREVGSIFGLSEVSV
jgi:hypothetical protein